MQVEVARERYAALGSYSAVARELGVAPSRVWKALNPEALRESNRRTNAKRAAAKRAWENEHRASCERCDRPLRAGSARADGSVRAALGLCAECMTRGRVDRVLEMIRLRREGICSAAIAVRVGCALNTVHQELSRARGLGFDVPGDEYAVKRGGVKEGKQSEDREQLARAMRRCGVEVPGR